MQFIYGENGGGLKKSINEKIILVFIMLKKLYFYRRIVNITNNYNCISANE